MAVSEHNSREEDDPQETSIGLSEGSVLGIDEKLMQLEMFHSHRPKVEELGYISWDSDAETISRGPSWDEAKPFLRLLTDHRDELLTDWV